MGFFKQTIKDVPLDGKVVLVRFDYDVPMNENGEVGDDAKIQASLPTLKYLLERGCRVVVVSHLGRPRGADLRYSLEPVAAHLAKLLKKDVRFLTEVYGDRVHQVVKRLSGSGILVLENLRFHTQEEANDEDFARKIAKSTGARYFVQDAFNIVYREYASTSAITLFIPSVAGLLLEREYKMITAAIAAPRYPLVTILNKDTSDFALEWDDEKGEKFGYISKGGRASLELIAGKKLPGFEALLDASH